MGDPMMLIPFGVIARKNGRVFVEIDAAFHKGLEGLREFSPVLPRRNT